MENYQQQFSVKVAQIEAPGLTSIIPPSGPLTSARSPSLQAAPPDEIENYDKRVPVEGGAFLRGGI